MTETFTDLLLASTSVWDDPDGFWSNYNAALAKMFETTFGIVADLGDVEQTVFAILSNKLSTTGPITSLSVQSISQFVPSGTEFTLAFEQDTQVYLTSADSHVGDSSITVESTTPNFEYPAGTPVQALYSPGWSRLLDPLECPDQYLPYLGQFNGTDIPPGLDAVTARQKILGESAHLRGTTFSITSAVQRNLVGTKSVFILERTDGIGNPNEYWFVVIVRPEEVPNSNPQPIIDAVNDVKPGGIQWTLLQLDGFTWLQAIHTWNDDTFSWAAGKQP